MRRIIAVLAFIAGAGCGSVQNRSPTPTDGGPDTKARDAPDASEPSCPQGALYDDQLRVGGSAMVTANGETLVVKLKDVDVAGAIVLVDYTNSRGTVTDLLMNRGEDYGDGTGFHMMNLALAATSARLCIWHP